MLNAGHETQYTYMHVYTHIGGIFIHHNTVRLVCQIHKVHVDCVERKLRLLRKEHSLIQLHLGIYLAHFTWLNSSFNFCWHMPEEILSRHLFAAGDSLLTVMDFVLWMVSTHWVSWCGFGKISSHLWPELIPWEFRTAVVPGASVSRIKGSNSILSVLIPRHIK